MNRIRLTSLGTIPGVVSVNDDTSGRRSDEEIAARNRNENLGWTALILAVVFGPPVVGASIGAAVAPRNRMRGAVLGAAGALTLVWGGTWVRNAYVRARRDSYALSGGARR